LVRFCCITATSVHVIFAKSFSEYCPLRLTYDEIIFIQESRGSDVVKVIGEQHIDDDPSSEGVRQKTPGNFLKEHFDIRTPLIITRKLSIQTCSFNFRNEKFVRQLSDGANYIS
jgi:hypothetical protein